MSKRKIIFLAITTIIVGFLVYRFLLPHHKMKIEKSHSHVLYEPEISEFNFPVYLSLKDIELLANRKLKTVLINKTVPAKNQKDSLIIYLKRTGNLKLKMDGDYIYSELPLHADIGIIKKFIGNSSIKIGNKNPISFDLIVRAKSSFSLDPSIKLKTKTVISEIVWINEPNAKIAGIDINLKNVVEDILQQRQDELTKRLDEILASKINLKKPITRIWGNLQKSIRATKHQPDLFVRIKPEKVTVHVDKSNSDSLKLNLHILSKVYSRFGKDTMDIPKVPLPKRVDIQKDYDHDYTSKISIHLLVPLKKINETLEKQLAGKTFTIKGYHLKIKKIEAIIGKKNLYLHAKISGDLSGNVWVQGIPELTRKNTLLNIKNVDIETVFNNKVFATIADMFNQEFRELIDDALIFEIGDIMNNITTFAQNGVGNTKFGIKNDVKINDISINNIDLKLNKNDIQILINGSGDFSLSVKKEGLKLKKFEFNPQ